MRKSLVLTLCLVLMIAAEGHSQYGGYGGEILRYGVGGRALGLGGAFTGVADDASAIFFNPAGLCQLDRFTLSYMSSTLFGGTRYQYFATAYPFYRGIRPFDKSTIGLAYVALGMEGFELREAYTHEQVGSFADRQSAVLLPYSTDWISDWGRLALAGELNCIRHELAGYADRGWGYGFALFAQPFDLPGIGKLLTLENLMKFRIGFAYRHLPTLRLFREAENLPDFFRFGMSYSTPTLGRRASILLSAEWLHGAGFGTRSTLGTELSSSLAPGISARVRMAMRYGEAWKDKGMVWGVGLESWDYKLAGLNASVSVNYVFDQHSVLGSANTLFLSLQIAGGRENVASKDLFARSRTDLPMLRRVLTWHPRDVRRVGWRLDREIIDNLYRDGLEAGAETGVAEILRRAAEERGNRRAAARYDAFILGFRTLNEKARKTLALYRAELGRSTAQLLNLIKDYSERRQKLEKCYNFTAVRLFLDMCSAVGDTTLLKSVLHREAVKNPCFGVSQRRYYEAILGSPGALEELRSQRSVGDDTLSYLAFVLAVRKGDASLLKQVARRPSLSYAFDQLPLAPLVGDGCVADDAELLLSLDNTDNGQVQNSLLKLMVKHPLSDGALIAGQVLSIGDSPEARSRALRVVREWYKNSVRPGGVVTLESFAKFVNTVREELP